MKQPTMLALFVLTALPFVLTAQHPAGNTNPVINETNKEERVQTFMKTSPMKPAIVLDHTYGMAPMNSTSKEQLKMAGATRSAASTSAAKRRNRQNGTGNMNLSAKEKMRLGL